MKELLLKIINLVGFAHWVEIVTQVPRCTYYFGPFMGAKEAEQAQRGYLDDLNGEGAQGITVKIKRCRPQDLTVFEESSEGNTIFHQRSIPLIP